MLIRKLTLGSIYSSAAIADLDGNGLLDIVVGSLNANIYCLEWDGATATMKWTYPTGGAIYSSAAIGDVDGDSLLEVVIGSNDGIVYCLDGNGNPEWTTATGGAVYSSPSLAKRQGFGKYGNEWPMFRNNPARTGVYGGSVGSKLGVYVGSEDEYFYLIDGSNGSAIDRFKVRTVTYQWWFQGVHTSAAIADVDGDLKLEFFFTDWGDTSTNNGHTFWAVEDVESKGNQPPDCSEAYPDHGCLWPPNHKFVDVQIIGVTDPDGDPITITITGITSDEPTATAKGAGGAKHAPDADGVGTDTASVRAERSGSGLGKGKSGAGPGNGRVYEISFTADDGRGGECVGTVQVKVPHDIRKHTCDAVDDRPEHEYDATQIN